MDRIWDCADFIVSQGTLGLGTVQKRARRQTIAVVRARRRARARVFHRHTTHLGSESSLADISEDVSSATMRLCASTRMRFCRGNSVREGPMSVSSLCSRTARHQRPRFTAPHASYMRVAACEPLRRSMPTTVQKTSICRGDGARSIILISISRNHMASHIVKT